MATNNFKPFATGTGANVLSQAEYEALAALAGGFTSGKASSAQINKALRQGTFIAASIAQFILNKSAIDVLDDGDLAGFVTDFGNALNKHSQPLDAGLTSLAALAGGANMLPYYTAADVFAQTSLTAIGRSLIGQSTAAAALSYLGGAPLASPVLTGTPTAPTAAVGTNTTQVATTAFVQAVLNALGLGLSGLNNATGLDWQNDDFITGTITRYQWQTFTNPPTLTGPQPAATANIVVTVKMVIGTTAVVELAAVRGATAYECYDVIVAGAKGSRTLTVRMTYQRGMGTAVAVSDGGTGATTPAGARTAFGFDDMGIGLSLSPLIANFDWQQADFITGSLQTFQFSASLNQPSGITYGSTTSVTVTTLQNRTSLIVVKVVPLTQSNGNRREYTVVISGDKGARVFYVNQNFNDDSSSVIPIANGGTGQTTAAAALAALGGAPLASPALTGTPTAPTAATATNNTQIATTAFVKTITNLLATIASPTFTGTPAAPTAAVGTSTTQLATTAFVGAAIAAAAGRLLNVQTFTSSGTYTPTTGTTRVVVEVLGAGGGSNYVPAQGSAQWAAAAGGGGGAYAVGYYTSGFSGVVVTVGAGGTAGIASSSTTAGAGGTSSFGTLAIAPGGSPGASVSIGTSTTGLAVGGDGGALPTGTIILGVRGGSGHHGFVLGGSLRGGTGGSAGNGAGGPSGVGSGNAGVAATGYGAGAGGGTVGVSGAAVNGGSGASGIVIIWEYA